LFHTWRWFYLFLINLQINFNLQINYFKSIFQINFQFIINLNFYSNGIVHSIFEIFIFLYSIFSKTWHFFMITFNLDFLVLVELTILVEIAIFIQRCFLYFTKDKFYLYPYFDPSLLVLVTFNSDWLAILCTLVL